MLNNMKRPKCLDLTLSVNITSRRSSAKVFLCLFFACVSGNYLTTEISEILSYSIVTILGARLVDDFEGMGLMTSGINFDSSEFWICSQKLEYQSVFRQIFIFISIY
jgi:hypothetical protein